MNSDTAGIILLVVFGGFVLLAYKISIATGVPFEIIINCLLKSIFLGAAYFVYWYLSRLGSSSLVIFPFVLGALYVIWWPAIDAHALSVQQNDYSDFFLPDDSVSNFAWYTKWYIKTIVLSVIVFGSYYINNVIRRLLI